MNYEKKEKRKLFYDDVFDFFARKFQYSISLVIIVIFQFVVVEGLILRIPKTGIITCSVLRCLVVLSAVLYSCSHVACRSYRNRKTEQINGLSRYRSRAVENFWAGLILFLIQLLVLLCLRFFEQVF